METKDEAYCALVDDALNPHAIIILQGGMLCAAGDPAVFASMMDELKHGRIDSENTWPPQQDRKSVV